MAAPHAPSDRPVPAPGPLPRPLLALLGLALIGHLLASALWVAPGNISIDEGVYELMAQAWAEGEGFTVDNGYSELPSRELYFEELSASPQVLASHGRLVAKYPYLLPVLARPLYPLQGFRGLFALNAMAFLGVAALVWALGRLLFGERALALLAVLIFGLGGYAWDYSAAAWPHMSATLASFGGLTLVVASVRAEGRRSLGLAAAAGLTFGLGFGLRLDVALTLGAAGVAVLLTPRPWGRAAALALGTLPGLLLLSWTNLLKFGSFAPFSYGTSEEGAFLQRGGAGLAALALGVLTLRGLARDETRAWLRARWVGVTFALGLVALVALALPPLRRVLTAELTGLRDLVWDLRWLQLAPDDVYARVLPRSEGGAIVYLGGVKTSLLQSLPWLPVLLLPAAALTDPRARRWEILTLLFVVLAHVMPFALTSWHGGQCLNLRYFVPALPAAALLGAWAIRSLAPSPRLGWGSFGVAAASALAVLLALPSARGGQAHLETLLLTGPLFLASLVALLAGIRALRPHQALTGALLLITAAGLGWAGAKGLGYDAALSRARRAANLSLATSVAGAIPDGALLFVTIHEPFYALKRFRDVTIANPTYDNGADFRALAEHHLSADHPVYGCMPQTGWRQLDAAGLLQGLSVQGVQKDGQFVTARLALVPEAAPAE